MSKLLNDDAKMSEFLESLYMYYTSRIDIKNIGEDDNSIEIIENSDSDANIKFPEWFAKKGKGLIIQSDKQFLDLKIKCIKDGILTIKFRGVHINDKKGNPFPTYIDYTSIKINGKEELEENKLVWFIKPFTIEKEVENGETITIHVEWKPFSQLSVYEDVKEENLLKSLYMYYTSRMDIKNLRDDDNSIEIIENSDPNAKIQFPEWFNNKGKGMILQSNKQSIDLKIKCIKDGILTIKLKGINIKDKENNRFPTYIDYTSIKINGKEELEENKLISGDNPLKITRRVKDNELITIHVEWKPFSSSSLYENKKIKELEEELKELKNDSKEIIKELEEENENLKRKLSLISNSSLLEIKKIKKEL